MSVTMSRADPLAEHHRKNAAVKLFTARFSFSTSSCSIWYYAEEREIELEYWTLTGGTLNSEKFDAKILTILLVGKTFAPSRRYTNTFDKEGPETKAKDVLRALLSVAKAYAE